MVFIELKEEEEIISLALQTKQSKVTVNGISISLTSYIKQVKNKKDITTIAKSIVSVLYEPITKPPDKPTVKRQVRLKGKIVNGIRYIV